MLIHKPKTGFEFFETYNQLNLVKGENPILTEDILDALQKHQILPTQMLNYLIKRFPKANYRQILDKITKGLEKYVADPKHENLLIFMNAINIGINVPQDKVSHYKSLEKLGCAEFVSKSEYQKLYNFVGEIADFSKEIEQLAAEKNEVHEERIAQLKGEIQNIEKKITGELQIQDLGEAGFQDDLHSFKYIPSTDQVIRVSDLGNNILELIEKGILTKEINLGEYIESLRGTVAQTQELLEFFDMNMKVDYVPHQREILRFMLKKDSNYPNQETILEGMLEARGVVDTIVDDKEAPDDNKALCYLLYLELADDIGWDKAFNLVAEVFEKMVSAGGEGWKNYQTFFEAVELSKTMLRTGHQDINKAVEQFMEFLTYMPEFKRGENDIGSCYAASQLIEYNAMDDKRIVQDFAENEDILQSFLEKSSIKIQSGKINEPYQEGFSTGVVPLMLYEYHQGSLESAFLKLEEVYYYLTSAGLSNFQDDDLHLLAVLALQDDPKQASADYVLLQSLLRKEFPDTELLYHITSILVDKKGLEFYPHEYSFKGKGVRGK